MGDVLSEPPIDPEEAKHSAFIEVLTAVALLYTSPDRMELRIIAEDGHLHVTAPDPDQAVPILANAMALLMEKQAVSRIEAAERMPDGWRNFLDMKPPPP